MNILRHKKWHVRTKENVARVRRDEAKAAEEEKARTERATIAEHEDRVRRLKSRADTKGILSNADEIFGKPLQESSTSSFETTKHVNLFAELEVQERKNLSLGNKEYTAEKKKEQDDWESKVGIMKRFAEDTKEYSKETEWWQGIPIIREKVEKPEKTSEHNRKKFLTNVEKRAMKKEKKTKKKKHKRRSSDSESSSEKNRKKAQIEQLRGERMARERQEQLRTQNLLNPKKEPESVKPVVDDRTRKYNSQFNPEFARY